MKKTARSGGRQPWTGVCLVLAAALSLGLADSADGRGIDAEQTKAAASRGNPAAMRTLGCMHYTGESVVKSRRKAMAWFSKAAAKGDASAATMLAAMRETDGRRTGAPQAHLDAVQNPPEQNLLSMALAGDVNAQTTLGLSIIGTAKTPDDIQQGARWIEAAAEGGNPYAKRMLGLLYAEGIGRPQDYAAARPLLDTGVHAGIPECMEAFGRMYLHGLGVRQNFQKAAELLRGASEKGERNAQREFAGMLINGVGVRQDCAEARRWLSASASAGDAVAAMQFAFLLAGQGECGAKNPERNEPQIKELFGKACDAGLQDGCDAYRMMNSGGMTPVPKQGMQEERKEDPV